MRTCIRVWLHHPRLFSCLSVMKSIAFSFTRRVLMAAVAAAVATASMPVLAQGSTPLWKPKQPVQITVPFPAGGGVDLVGRALAQELGDIWGVPVVVDNVGGAAGAVGIAKVNVAKPDGLHLAISSAGNVTIGPLLRGAPYEPMQMTHVARLTTSPVLLLARPDLPDADVAAFIESAKQSPETVRFGSGGVGSTPHLAQELMNIRMGVKMLHVPYRGTSPMLTDLIAGHLDVGFSDVSGWSFVTSGKARLLAVSTPTAWEQSPQTPTLEGVLPPYAIENWYGLVAPPGLPAEVQAGLSDAVQQALARESIQKIYANAGFTAAFLPREQFDPFLEKEIALWKEVIEKADIRAE